ncbi:MCE family protein [Streptomyces sp. TRM70308]|uniref:MCE family protein n=1 Tax=Streptomyces sp. TRM70308 TaxID=3131932 RepID=UPI003D05C28E
MRERRPALVGAVGLLLLALVGVLAYHAGAFASGTRYTAEFTESAGLGSGDEVRVAGVRVGEVEEVALDGDRVAVTFTVSDVWVGDASTVGIAIKTLLGAKYLALRPLGTAEQDPGERIPAARTTSPYDVVEAFQGLGETAGAIDTDQLAKSFTTLADTFRDTPPDVREAVTGLADLSRVIADRDAELAELLSGSSTLSETLSDQGERFENLLADGNQLLAEVRARRDAIGALLEGSRDLGTELRGLVADNEDRIKPTLDALTRVTTVLEDNKEHLDATLAAAGPYYRLIGNATGSGHWLDAYLCGVVPDRYLPAGTPPERGCVPPRPAGSEPQGGRR